MVLVCQHFGFEAVEKSALIACFKATAIEDGQPIHENEMRNYLYDTFLFHLKTKTQVGSVCGQEALAL